MKPCPKCGEPTSPPIEIYCTQCGTKLDDDDNENDENNTQDDIQKWIE